MCFTFYTENQSQASHSSRHQKQYLYHILREQPIWKSLRFWNAAFFDALQTERANRPTPTKCQLNEYNSQEITDENKFQQNITFGQLGYEFIAKYSIKINNIYLVFVCSERSPIICIRLVYQKSYV